jgi:hypothetical protein
MKPFFSPQVSVVAVPSSLQFRTSNNAAFWMCLRAVNVLTWPNGSMSKDRCGAGVKVVVTDLHEPFRKAATEGLPNAVLVADPMHVVMAANRCPDKTRRRVQNEELVHRGRTNDPLYAARKLLLTAAERLSPRLAKRLDVMLAFGDPNGQVYEAWMTKELVRDLYTLWGKPDDAARWIDSLIDDCRASAVPEVKGLGRVLAQWRYPILSWHTTGASNGPAEGLNSIIKKLKRVATGFRRFDQYRTRILLAIGGVNWNLSTPPDYEEPNLNESWPLNFERTGLTVSGRPECSQTSKSHLSRPVGDLAKQSDGWMRMGT